MKQTILTLSYERWGENAPIHTTSLFPSPPPFLLGGHGGPRGPRGLRDGWEEQTHVISVCCTQIITFTITKLLFLEIQQLHSLFSCSYCIWEVFILSSTGFKFQYQLFTLFSLSIYPFWFIVHLNGLSLWVTFNKGLYMLNFLNSWTFEMVFLFNFACKQLTEFSHHISYPSASCIISILRFDTCGVVGTSEFFYI